MNTSSTTNPTTLTATDICQLLRIDLRIFKAIRNRAPSPFGKEGEGFPKQVLTAMRSPLDIEIERLQLTPFPDPELSTDADLSWNLDGVKAWLTENPNATQLK